jgi:PAS domain S-box-containing protein
MGMNYDRLTKKELIEELTAVKKQLSKTNKTGKTIPRGDSKGKRRVKPKKSGNSSSPTGHAAERRYRVKGEDGTIRQIYEVMKDVHDERGAPLYTEGALYEITNGGGLTGMADSTEQTEIICRFRPDGSLTYVNEAYCRYFGCEREDLKDRNILLAISEQDRQKVLSQLRNLNPERPVGTTECRVMNSFGELLWNQWSYRAIFDGEGHILEYHSVGRDITYRKYTQDVLEKRAAILEAMTTAAEGFLKSGSWADKIETVLESFGKATGASHVFLFENDVNRDEGVAVRRRFEWFSPPISRLKGHRRFLKTRDLATRFSRWVFAKSEGKPIYGSIGQFPDREVDSLALEPTLSIAVVPIIVGGRWWGFVGFADYLNEIVWADDEIAPLEAAAGILGAAIERDEKEQTLKENERRFREQERFLSSVFDSIQDGIGVLDRELNVVRTNPVMENWPVVSRPLVGRKCYESIYGRKKPCRDCPALKTLKTGEGAREIRPSEGPDGTWWMEIFTYPLRDVLNGPLTGVIEYVRDITERVRAEDARKVTEERLQAFLNSTQDIVFLKDEQFRFSFVNGAMCDLLGRKAEEIVGGYDADFYPEGKVEEIRKADLRAQKGRGAPLVTGLTWGDRVLEGVKFPVGLGSGRTGIGGIFRDITERKRTEEKLKQSEERLRTFIDASKELIFLKDADFRYLFLNKPGVDFCGFEGEDVVLGKTDYELFPKESADEMRKGDLAALRKKTGSEVHQLDMNGRTLEVTKFKVPLADGRTGVGGIAQDVTEKKKTEDALRASELRYRELADNMPAGIYEATFDGKVIYANRTALEMFGYGADEVEKGIKFQEVIAPDEREKLVRHVQMVRQEGMIIDQEYTMLRTDGSRFVGLNRARPMMKDGRVVGSTGVVTDITDQKKAADILRFAKEELEKQVAERTRELDVANMLLRIELEEHHKTEEALVKNEQLYRAIVEDQTELICRFHPDGAISFVNEAFCRYFGKSRKELLGSRYRPVILREDRIAMTKAVKALTPDNHITHFEIRVELPGQGLRWHLWTNRAIYDEVGRLIEHQAVGRDMTERVQSQQQIRESRNMLRSVFDGISDPLVMVGGNLTVIMLNKAALGFFDVGNYRELIGLPCLGHLIERYGEDQAKRVVAAIGESNPYRFDLTANRETIRYEEVSIYPVRGVDDGRGLAIIRIADRTKQMIMERELIQNEKLASLGLLISGIVHEINNPNNFIVFNIPILRDYLREILPIVDEHAEKDPLYEVLGMTYPDFRVDVMKLLDNIEHGSHRINVTVAKLKEFSRKRDDKGLRLVASTEVIQKALSICHTQIRKAVKTFDVEIDPGLPPMTTDPEAIEQVLINLLINASQAADKEDSFIRLHVHRGDSWKNRLVMEVTDNGCGMDERTAARVFEPFFTTKEAGCGTGLGLYISKNLIESADGSISLESEVGRGTTFRVIFPDLESREPEKKHENG